MTKVFFESSYILVIPFYDETSVHSHNMLHVFFGKENLTCDVDGSQISGSLLILENDVVHKSPKGEIAFFLFVDPTSTFAELLRKDFLKGKKSYGGNPSKLCLPYKKESLSKDFIKEEIKKLFGNSSFFKKENIDSRILLLLDNIDSFKHLNSKVSELAVFYGYSESYLTHLFKKETGIALKSYLLMKQFEYVWHEVLKGASLTSAAMDAGFSSPSHFSDVCRKLTGISFSKVFEKKADL